MGDFYDAKSVEESYYKIWEDRGYFEIDCNKQIQKEGRNFCIMMPPPNVTGVLHIGHALTFTLQDIITRYKRMDGYAVLWQPGLDHAGIATQNIVEKQLLAEGTTKEAIGREAFLQRVWKWKESSGGRICSQLRRLGATPVWSRERFTMDEGLKNAVREAFVSLYEKGLIYRGNYMVNWCTHDGALSDIEVEHQPNKGKLYYLRYFLAGSKEFVVVATTRPETYFGDTAVMVNPQDERYAHLLGREVELPLTNKRVRIIADEHVDAQFGTGIVKVTPAHDTNDYEVGKRHGLEFVTIFDEKGILNDKCGKFAGLERLAAREIVVGELEKGGFVEKIEDYENQVGYCYRCKNVVEPYISKQWFVKPDIAQKAVADVAAGGASFFPPHWINSFNAWMRDLQPWCISRQLWWGHRIPVFYCECGHEFAAREESPKSCPKCGGSSFTQDKDVLDTWFSSGLWPISTLGWGNGEALRGQKWFEGDLQRFYPNSLLITGFDILFFWVARMMFQCENATQQLPFSQIYLHALVKDKEGKKMSKSSGNVIDPLSKIEEFSADALRFSLAVLCVAGRDIRMSDEALVLSRNFINKLYNAMKFLLANSGKEAFGEFAKTEFKTQVGRWMKARFEVCVNEVRQNLDAYRFNDAASALQRFLWDEFCDWGIELLKAQKEGVGELGAVFKEAMKLLSLFMPFFAEFAYHELSKTSLESAQSVMVTPLTPASIPDAAVLKDYERLKEAVVSLRRAKATIELGNSKIPAASVRFFAEFDFESVRNFAQRLAKVENIKQVTAAEQNCVRDISENLESFVGLEGVDLSAITARLNAQKSKLTKEFEKLNAMLSNDKFVKNAPPAVIEENRAAAESARLRLAKIDEELSKFA